MARFLLPLLRRSFLSVPGSHPSVFDENLLRLLRNEISYLSDYLPPRPVSHSLPLSSLASFSIEDHPGEQWIRLRSKHGDEDVKVDVTMFDGAAPVPSVSIAEKVRASERGPRLHISLIVEVSRGEASDSVLELICSAWPDSLDVETLFPLHRKVAVFRPYFGRNFKNLEKEVRRQVISYLEERGVDDDLAEFLHEYMTNKDKVELLRWLRIVESYVQK
ncbi:hypothetical protein BHE74_00002772 [Ensete ventricosum]|nr:hypothetical protein GW17_00029561 [Ensete ventricosum]RWW88356.1 hypothetical protein BHE74_00002772 [Ensete ventricosum]RZR81012.1 hypothetical protein BHM03_00007154 [Ensete ventricosum]